MSAQKLLHYRISPSPTRQDSEDSNAFKMNERNFIESCKKFFEHSFCKNNFDNLLVLSNEAKVKSVVSRTYHMKAKCIDFEGCERDRHLLLDCPVALGVADRIMQLSNTKSIFLKTSFLAGYVRENQKTFVMPLFIVYESKVDKMPLFVDANANVYLDIFDLLNSANLPPSFICLHRNCVFQLDDCSDMAPLIFYDKNSNGLNVGRIMRLPFFKFHVISGIWEELFKNAAVKAIHLEKPCSGLFEIFNISSLVSPENIIYIAKKIQSFYIEFMSASKKVTPKVHAILSWLTDSLLKNFRIYVPISNSPLMLTLLKFLFYSVCPMNNIGEDRSAGVPGMSVVLLFEGVEIFNLILPNLESQLREIFPLFHSMSIGNTANEENLRNKAITILDFVATACAKYGINPLVSLNLCFRLLQNAYYKFIARNVKKNALSSEDMENERKIIDLSGEDYSLSNFLRISGLMEGTLNEDYECHEEDVAMESAVRLVQVLVQPDGTTLYTSSVSMAETVALIRNYFKIEDSIAFVQENNTYGELRDPNIGTFKFLDLNYENGNNVFVYHCRYTPYRKTCLQQSSEN